VNDALAILVLASEETDAAHAVPLSTTLLFAGLLVAMIGCLAFEEKLHARKSLIVGLFAGACLLLGEMFDLIHRDPVNFLGHEIDLPVYIPGIDWGVIAIILGSSIFVDVTSKTGLFSWTAIKLTKASGGDPVRLLWFYGVMTVVFSAVLNNVTAMVIVGSLSGVSLRKLDKAHLLLGFLLVEGLLTNVGGMLTLVSSVPNIIVGTTAGISFVSFFLKAAGYVVVATVATIVLGAKLFGIRGLASDAERAEAEQLVAGFDERDSITSPGFFWFGAVMLVLFVVAIAMASVPDSDLPVIRELGDLGMGFVALAFAAIMLIRHKHEVQKFYQALDWDLLGFFAALFAVINVMEHAQVLALIGRGLEHLIGLGDTAGPGALLVASAAASSVTDNIPLAAMLAKILGAIPEIGGDPDSPFWWAVVFGANLGGNLTPIGSASTLVAVTIIHRYELRLTFAGFVAKALPFAAMQIAIALLYVLVVMRLLS
jgi:Na+/H+ antiporter NhaD/arsenite permease-like protein